MMSQDHSCEVSGPQVSDGHLTAVWSARVALLLTMAHYRQKQIIFYLSLTALILLSFTVLDRDLSSPPRLELSWDSGPSHHFWPEDRDCAAHTTRFVLRHSLPARALVSYPGSGNTWIRYLVEAATGVFTGSIFNDKSILRAGHYGEARDYRDGTTILQKTHHRALYVSQYKNYGLAWRRHHVQQFSGRGVLVIRNPYKAILSYWNFKNTKSHTKTVDVSSLHSEQFLDFVRVGAERWLEVIKDWLQLSTSCQVILYEVSLEVSQESW